MNWLGAGFASVLAAVLGALVGAFVHFEARRHGVDFPPIVGLVAGVATALASNEKSGMRGVLVASLAVWATALAEVFALPRRGIVSDLITFHERLGGLHVLGYLACAAGAALLASRAPTRRESQMKNETPATSATKSAIVDERWME